MGCWKYGKEPSFPLGRRVTILTLPISRGSATSSQTASEQFVFIVFDDENFVFIVFFHRIFYGTVGQ